MRSDVDWISSYMKYVEDTEPPLLYHEWSAVMVIASALRRKTWLYWGINDYLYPNLYVVLVGPAGRCRKGTAMAIGRMFLSKIGIKLAPSTVTREALIRSLAEATEMVTTDDGQHLTHASLSIWSPEWAVFLGGKENIKLINDLTDWYDCGDTWEYLTKTSGTDHITNVWVNMFGATTPSSIRSTLPYTETEGGGFLSRIIFVYEENKHKIVPAPFETQEMLKIKDRMVDDLSEIAALSGPFKMTGDAMDFYTEWYLKMDSTNPKMPVMFEGYLNRRQTQLRKLGMIMSASEGSDMIIKRKHFERALSLLKRTEIKMPRTFSGMGTSKDAELFDRLLTFIARRRKVHVKEVYTQFRSFLDSVDHFNQLVQKAAQIGFCKLQVTGSDTYIVYNPNNPIHDQYGK